MDKLCAILNDIREELGKEPLAEFSSSMNLRGVHLEFDLSNSKMSRILLVTFSGSGIDDRLGRSCCGALLFIFIVSFVTVNRIISNGKFFGRGRARFLARHEIVAHKLAKHSSFLL
ncbi:hypothetical protein BK147_11775 [Paenibacillus sp. FSL R7-0337]|nr:hypothetical protein BK147_11775 [Paenibacillus sp. FSL R7-0337]